MDLKCPDSGECENNLWSNLALLKPSDQIKFVIASRRDFDWTADAIRLLLRTTHNLAEGAGAAGLAGLRELRAELGGKAVAVILSGSNIDEVTLRRIVTGIPARHPIRCRVDDLHGHPCKAARGIRQADSARACEPSLRCLSAWHASAPQGDGSPRPARSRCVLDATRARGAMESGR